MIMATPVSNLTVAEAHHEFGVLIVKNRTFHGLKSYVGHLFLNIEKAFSDKIWVGLCFGDNAASCGIL